MSASALALRPNRRVQSEMAAAADLPAKPVLAVFMAVGPPPASLADAGIPTFTYPNELPPRSGRSRSGPSGGPGPPATW